MSLQGKKIILGISASIAAYKSIQLVRLLTKEGAEVRVVLTKAALDFVSPLFRSIQCGWNFRKRMFGITMWN
jgi:phosphopantothenoylcysteine decarboxylase/phosphopantothenate--cysteine ligase